MENTVDWTKIVEQVPILVTFVWFSFEMWKRFVLELDKRDEAFERRNLSVVTALDKLGEKMDSYTERMAMQLDIMLQRQTEHDILMKSAVEEMRAKTNRAKRSL